ncbi:MAG: hypothetical protein CL791_02680 [Chloroflexi bacterium]|nr:hypothetical protein [Chloroflexota bacterium]
MPLHPQVKELMQKRTALDLPDNHRVSPEEARANARRGKQAIPTVKEPIGDISERHIPGPADDITVRIYRPDTQGPQPLIMFFSRRRLGHRRSRHRRFNITRTSKSCKRCPNFGRLSLST